MLLWGRRLLDLPALLGEALKETRCSLPKLIISLGRRYVQYINRKSRRTGTLWESRYKSSLLQAKMYLLTGMRYIELNPVRAAMVDEPAHYRSTGRRSRHYREER
ncbi:hypothetical protein BH20PSE1_BH20PSE1_14410 [soil metagenome]